LRASPSRCRSRRFLASCLAIALGLVPGALAHAADEGATAAAGACAPLPGDDADAGPSASALCAGIAPSGGTLPAGDDARGRIVTLPGVGATRTVDAMPGEALLVLPKGAGGKIDTDFVLAPGARIADSYWSPVLCATVVRVSGPPGTSPEQLVTKRPRGSRLSPNKRYVTSATSVRPFVLAQAQPAQAQTAPAPAAGAAPTPPAPDDPYVPLQYGLARTGALEGWPALDGHGIRVAVLDSAPDVSHRELARVRIVTVDGGAPPPAAAHGTLVSGVIAAAENNAFGIAGIAGKADVIAIPVCTPSADGAGDECRLDALLRGLDVAWREDARVANLSLVGPPDPLLEHATRRMRELGILLVAAAGNEGAGEPRYPAAYPSVLGVGAFDKGGAPWPRSNHGDWVRLLAPGVEVLSTVPGDAFAFGDGTSLAAAHVTGLLALALMATNEPLAAEKALLDAGQAGASVAIPKLCNVVERLGARCPGR